MQNEADKIWCRARTENKAHFLFESCMKRNILCLILYVRFSGRIPQGVANVPILLKQKKTK